MHQPHAEYTITIDDDPLVSRIIEKATAIRSVALRCGQDVLSAELSDPVAIFVDILLDTEPSGLDLIPLLRERWHYRPILMITANPSEEAVMRALGAGADDFITKPIRTKELIARLQARLSDQAKKQANNTIEVFDAYLDVPHHLLRGGGGLRYLSATETNLLVCLSQAKGTVVPRETLKLQCWGPLKVSDGALDRKIFEVRRALEDVRASAIISTTYGVGFGLELRKAS